ncbi:aspartyl/glutamyl-tRNA(Asn/Gln) amidotransferase subunit B [Marinicauda pacifica]|uniref:Aspartyl/glutamyl-tRNA(Asn/Gln) amidotransferase subunit B n=1 Tax=Marinicauda pacifica TaxID=1133559 RepID=A0A4S2HEX3_9PROT|nr:Asp-tRNA(Asn)/Glu-tRNA(Gln) amidotransferase subunit GatB [Marinicauda pacifica]TGY94361.1 Asp-tRNA(Asn)/Glu-tRNA(Gln) amidotransferase subunit GatB [Marinicauda pacifica]GGE35155.1 aspartyl/glutamyl-tRNA(Asn/Gln) amidotransferase subunit B [Marinicauda pacifica]
MPLDTADYTYRIPGQTGDWEIVVGLEVHAQVRSKSKLFSGASTEFGAAPNSHVSLVDAAMPGMLPVINEECVAQAVRTGLGLNAKINRFSRFDRKNYFYPDLPQGYQISQFEFPIVGEGEIECERDDGSRFTVGIERLHLEQDAGKSIHDLDPNATYVDLNRSGVALMEIVSRPHLRSPGDAAAYVRTLRTIVRYLDTCGGDMEKGQMRADVNVSVCKPGAYEKFRESGDFSHLGTRCEIKNVNSLRFIQQAIEYEAQRQIDLLEDGGKVIQQTRLFDANTGVTRAMRSKEEAHDYRYFPDPDLLPLKLEEAFIETLKAGLPELPAEKRERFVSRLGLSEYDASVLAADKDRADYFEKVIEGRDAKLAANWVNNELFGRLNKEGLSITESPVGPQQLGKLVKLIEEDVISGKIAKEVFEILWDEGGDPEAIVEKKGLKQITDTGAIEKVVDDLIAQNPEQAAQVRDKPKAMGWFVGQVMKATGGKANPQAVNEILQKKLLG